MSTDEEIERCRQELRNCPSWRIDRFLLFYDLAGALFKRYQQVGGIEYLEESITYCRQAIDLSPIWSPFRHTFLTCLSAAVSARFEQSGRMEDLEEAITCSREALALCYPESSDSALNNLGNAVFTRFKHSGRIEDLEEAITCHREALALCPHGHPDRIYSLNNLATAVFTRFKHSGRMEDLEGAITCYREALTLCPDDHIRRATSLSNLGAGMSNRFHQLGRMEDLEEAITCSREALALCPHSHPLRSSCLVNLANAVSTRFKHSGRMEDLEEAITCYREALALCPRGHPRHASFLGNLDVAVSTRFKQSGRMEDLEEVIKCHREALALRPHGHPDRSLSLGNLANGVIKRFHQSGRMEDLEEGITCHGEALAICPLGDPNHALFLSDLAMAVSIRYEQSGRTEDFEEAITCHRKALALFPHGHTHRSSTLGNLGSTMFERFKRSGSKDDLLDAHKYISEAKTMLPAEHPRHAMLGRILAVVLLRLADIVPKSNESLNTTSEAFGMFEQAAIHSFASAKTRLHAAVEWAREARLHKHHSTVRAYAKSFSLLHLCLVLTPTVESQQNFLAGNHTVPKELALEAASSAIDAGEFGTAVEFLEQGRAVLWSKLRGYRHPLDELRAIDKKLADQFEALGGQLEFLATSSEPQLTGSNEASIVPASFDTKMQRLRILSEEWDDIVGKIRQIDGFADFLQAVPFKTLQKAAAEGPVIIINISSHRSDAIILRDIGDPVLIPLPETLPKVLNELSSQFTKARDLHGKESARQILPMLRSLWDNIVFPVRVQLVASGVPDKSRIWWCPTSDLCALPLHAAGAYSPKVAKPDNLPDCYISSYTPTLSALIRARSGILPRSTDPNLLVIAQPDETLPEVEEEISRIQRITNHVDVLKGPEANHDTVLSSLRNHSWAHFACHGHLNKQPFHSSFQLHDHSRLALVELIRARLADAELAFLSACHTAAGDMEGTPDEVIHLAAAMQFCGFRSVVGTLWAMEDVDGRDVTEDFYRHMFRVPGAIPNFRESAEALNLATRQMRKRKLSLDRWVKFVHIGA